MLIARGRPFLPIGLLLIGICLSGCGPADALEQPVRAIPAVTGSATPSPVPGADTVTGEPGAPVPSLAAVAPVAPADRPARIAIPSIGVDSSLVDLGVARDGTLEVPADYQRAGWLDRSAVPGRQGPAVIAGHVDSQSGPAVFYRLTELKPGARISVTSAGGRTAAFTVDSVQRYSKRRFPTATVYGPVPGPVLRLITCGGQFDRASGHYRDNIVVYAS